ncbi:MAG: 50S ribosomal protein L25 [Balneolaceae bacterium]
MTKPELVPMEGRTRETGKRSASQLRKEKHVPSVLYGPNVKENLHFSVDEADLEKLLSSGRTTFQDLKIDSKSYTTLLKRVEYDPITDRPIHADFYVMDEKQPVTLRVPIRLKGIAAGVRDGGGRVLQPLRILRIKALPDRIPALFEVDITELNIGDSVHVSELEMEGLVPLDDNSRTIVTVAPPKSEALFTSSTEEESELLGELEDEEAVADAETEGEETEGEGEGEETKTDKE